ncbi:MAG: response regulator [Limisphaerales bacterium]
MNSARKVLVIGAEPATVSFYSSHLEPAGFSLASASLGDPILEKVRESEAEAVMLDLSSPSPSGAEALRRIRSEPAFESLPLFVLSSGAAVEPADELARDARVKVFQKGSGPTPDVARAIEEILNARKAASLSAGIPQTQPAVVGEVQADHELIETGLSVTKKLSDVVRTFCRTAERERRVDLLAVMRQEARSLRETFSGADFKALANFASALERLFNALAKDVGAVNGSTLKTVSHAIDFLAQAASSNSGHDEMARTPIRMLAVDDDPVCLRTLMMLASKNNGVRLVACDGAEPALVQLKTGEFDLILSDILMPGMNGFEFVAEVRKLPNHRTTPVVFVTGLSDFETRSRSVLSGGCDLIAKPFTAGEVLVKVLTLGLKRRFDSAAAVVTQVERQPQEVRPNGAPQDSELPFSNNGGNGHEALEPESSRLRGLAARGVIVVEEHGGIRSINMTAAELLGYSPDEAANGDIRALIPDELQSEENKALLSQALAGTVKNKSGVKMTGRRKDNSTVELLVSVGETWAGRERSIMCLLQPASPPATAKGIVCAPSVDAKSAAAEMTPRLEQRNTTLAELIRAKEYWEGCAGERAALLEELRNRLRGQDCVVENLRRESEALKGLLERQAKEQLERQSELKELIRAKEYWEGCAGERAALLEEQKNRLRGEDCTVEALRRESEALKGFCKARVTELQQTRILLERQAKEHLERQSELQCRCATIQAQVDSLTESLAKKAAGGTAAEQQAGELAALRGALEQELAASRKREENLRAGLKAAEAAVAELEKSRAGLGQELSQAQGKVGELTSRVGELESRLQAEVDQRGNWERRSGELEQARVVLEGEIRAWAEREGQLKSECARLEQQGQGLTESLNQAQGQLAKEAAGRTAVEQQAGELAALRGALEQELAASRKQKEDLEAQFKVAEAAVAGLEKNRMALGHKLAEAQRSNDVLRGETKRLAADHQALTRDLSQAKKQGAELSSRVGELESRLEDQVSQTQAWEQRNSETERARALLEGEIRQHVEREDGLRAKCAAFELQLTRISESLVESRARAAAEETSRAAAEGRLEELSELQIAAGRELAERARLEKQLRQKLEEDAKRLSDCEASLSAAETLVGEKAKALQAVEARVAVLADRESYLERELADLQQANQSLEAKANALAVTQQAAAEELVELRGQAVRLANSEQQLRHELEVQVTELQRSKEELTRVLQAAHKREEERQQIINALESQFKEGLAKLTSL